MGDMVGVMLAAGSSTRMGRPKQLLPLGTSTVLGRSVAAAEASTLDRVVVVVPRDIPEVAERLPPGRAEPVPLDQDPAVVGPDHQPGCSSSLQTALAVVDELDADALVLLLGDMPTLSAAVIDQIGAAWRARPSWAAVTDYRDGIGHPLVFSADAFTSLRELHGDKAVWKIIERESRERVRRIAIDEARPPDVDTWDDYLEVCRALGVRPTERP
jgi:molybdenum cofactor cytidylyltransferase